MPESLGRFLDVHDAPEFLVALGVLGLIVAGRRSAVAAIVGLVSGLAVVSAVSVMKKEASGG